VIGSDMLNDPAKYADPTNINYFTEVPEYKPVKAKYYFESHITIEPLQTELQAKWLQEICNEFGFKLAKLFMLKDRKETPERSNRDTFMTAHSKDLDDIKDRTFSMVAALQMEGLKVFRYKIEDCIIDSRSEDVWGLLGEVHG
jgi:hypothetical protein